MNSSNLELAIDGKEVNRVQIEELTSVDAPSWMDVLLVVLIWLSGYL